MLITILATAVVLGVLIFVHELGHFMTAKWVDIEVPRFSIGFGPKVFGFRRGETEYVLSLLPLGGYVKMAGMEEMETMEGGPASSSNAPPGAAQPTDEVARPRGPRDFEAKSLPARALVISAGVLMNLLFAFLAFSSVGMIWGVPSNPPSVVGGVAEDLLPAGTEALARLPRGARITSVGGRAVDDFADLRLQISAAPVGPLDIGLADAAPVRINVPESDSLRARLAAAIEPVFESEARLSEVVEGGPAEVAGLERGDVVVAAGGNTVATWQDFVAAIEATPGSSVPVTVERDGTRLELSVIPRADTLSDGTTYGRIGVGGPTAARLLAPRERQGPLHALAFGAEETWRWTRLTVEFLGGLFSGRQSVRNVGGPIMIGQISGEVARAGAEAFINFMALLSVNLAVLNLLPIPVLDGGHLVFLAIEGIRGRALSLQQRIRLTQVGMVLILGLMVLALGNDLMRLIGR
jgi:regulator of sigma E protease